MIKSEVNCGEIKTEQMANVDSFIDAALQKNVVHYYLDLQSRRVCASHQSSFYGGNSIVDLMGVRL